MRLVKWVFDGNLKDRKTDAYVIEESYAIPVIPLVALTEVVEGLKEINAKSVIAYSIAPELSATACLEINKVSQRLLTQLEAHRKEGDVLLEHDVHPGKFQANEDLPGSY